MLIFKIIKVFSGFWEAIFEASRVSADNTSVVSSLILHSVLQEGSGEKCRKDFHAAQDSLHSLSLSCCRAWMAGQEPKTNLKPHFPLAASAARPWSLHGNFAGMGWDYLDGEKRVFLSPSVPFPAEQIWPSPGKGAALDLVITHVLA